MTTQPNAEPACRYCRDGQVFRHNQNCPRCGKRGRLAANHDRVRKAKS